MRTRGSSPASSSARRRRRARVVAPGSCRSGKRACRDLHRRRPLRPPGCSHRGRSQGSRRARARPTPEGRTTTGSWREASRDEGRRRAERADPAVRTVARGSRLASGGASVPRQARAPAAGGRDARKVSLTVSVSSIAASTCRARSTKSVDASSSMSGGRSNRVSAETLSASRLVSTTRSDGVIPTNEVSSAATLGSSCSTLSSTRCVRRSPTRAEIPSADSPSAPSAPATDGRTRDASRSAASGMKNVPPSASSAIRRESSIANRVLPVPPGPRIVRIDGASVSTSDTAS